MTATTGEETVIPHEQKLYLLWLSDAPQKAVIPHPDLTPNESDVARRKLIGRKLIHSLGCGSWTPTEEGKQVVQEIRGS